jgi:3-(3-hydroxy-phenyl)propionate hydroxylase
MARYRYQRFAYVTPPELRGARPRRWPVIVVGAGPVGLAAAIDLAQHGIDVLVLDDNDVVSIGSRAICWSQRTLQIFDRLGVGERMRAKGVTWQVGRLFHREREIYSFDLLPEAGHKMPAFINLQQYHVEQLLVDRALELGERIALRWRHRVTGLERRADGVAVTVETPDGACTLEADWLLACDGVKSTIRRQLGLDLLGRAFEERFLIADVEMAADFPSERWFWFEPPFHDGQSALLHKQPDGCYRIDLQLGPDADAEAERQPERFTPRIAAMVGGRPFEVHWASVYSFQCRRLERFGHGRVLFLGDSAHVVSPFGARGGNGGIQDVDNLAWKLALVLHGQAPASLLESYDEERVRAADENILHSARSTSFMTPKTAAERQFRDGVLALAADLPFARRLVNSGRLSQPCVLAGCRLQSAAEAGAARLAPGMPCPDAPLLDANGRTAWLLEHLGGGFVLLQVGDGAAPLPDLPGLRRLVVTGQPARAGPGEVLQDRDGLARKRYGAGCFLVRPDQHLAACWAVPEPAAIARALRRCRGLGTEEPA